MTVNTGCLRILPIFALSRIVSVLLWLVPAALVTLACFVWNVPLTIFVQIAILLWLTTVSGALLLSAISKWDLTSLERVTIGTAIGFGSTPLIFLFLRSFDVWQYTVHVVSLLNIILLAIGWKRKNQQEYTQQAQAASNVYQLIAIVSVAALIAIAYNVTGLHFDRSGDLLSRGLFGIDVPFLVGVLPSIQHTGYFADYHQAGLTYSYHDFTYIVAAIVGDLPPNDNLSLLAYAFPIFGFAMWGVSVYALTLRSLPTKKLALYATVGILLLSSVWGDHLLTGALSPSYLVGLIVLFSSLIVLETIVHERCSIWEAPLLLVLLIILIKNKLPIYLVLGGGLGLFGLIQLRYGLHARMIVVPVILSLPFLFLFGSASNPLQPAGDFLIGAPLMGYGNQLANLLGVAASSVDPVVQQLRFEMEDLLILPFTVVHIFRMTLLDGRLLLSILVWLLLRKKIEKQEVRWLHVGIISALIGLLLPILYSPSWYPLAVSFYTPEIGAMIAGAIALTVLIRSWSLLGSMARTIVAACIVYGMVGCAITSIESLSEKPTRLDRNEVAAMRWIKENTPADAVIAFTRSDNNLRDTVNDESFYLYGALSERRAVSAGAKYGSLLAAVADLDTVKGLHPVGAAVDELQVRRDDLNTIYGSSDAEAIKSAFKKYNSQYVLTTNSNPIKRIDLFEPVYRSEEINVQKLRD